MIRRLDYFLANAALDALVCAGIAWERARIARERAREFRRIVGDAWSLVTDRG